MSNKISQSIGSALSSLVSFLVMYLAIVYMLRVVSRVVDTMFVARIERTPPPPPGALRLLNYEDLFVPVYQMTAPATGGGAGGGAKKEEKEVKVLETIYALTPSEAKKLIMNVIEHWYKTRNELEAKYKHLPEEERKKKIPAPPSIMLVGPPGVGKSVVVREVAEEIAKLMGREFRVYDPKLAEAIVTYEAPAEKLFIFHDFRLTEVEPSDLLGIPKLYEAGGYFIYYPPLWARMFATRNIAGVLFLDELTNVIRTDVLALAYKIFLDRRAGELEFAKDVIVFAAGNPTEWSTAARMVPAPLANRVLIIKVGARADESFILEWGKWMYNRYGDNWAEIVLYYLLRFPSSIMASKAIAETLEGFPSPRSWTWLALYAKEALDKYMEVSKEIYRLSKEYEKAPEPKKREINEKLKKLKEEEERLYKKIFNIAMGYLGREAATSFVTWLRKPVPGYEELKKKPELFPTSPDEQFLCISYLASAIRSIYKEGRIKEEIPYIAKIFDYMLEKKYTELFKLLRTLLEAGGLGEVITLAEEYKPELRMKRFRYFGEAMKAYLPEAYEKIAEVYKGIIGLPKKKEELKGKTTEELLEETRRIIERLRTV